MAKRILIVDDDLTFIMLLRGKLEREGYEVDEAHVGKDAEDMVFQNPYDLVLMDFSIPDIRGHEICQSIRSKEHLQKLPIIMITAFQNRSEDFFKEEGATDVMYKPLDHDVLMEKIQNYTKN